MKNEKLKIKNLFFRFWPIVFIFLIWFIFSSPYFLKDKVPFASTYQVNNFAPWSAYPQFAGPVKNGAMPDVITQIYPWKHFTIETLKSGQIPLWNPYSFSGTPHLANYQSAVLSPFNLLFFLLPFIQAWSILVLLQPLLAGVFMYIFARSIERSKIASLLSSISFMFCGFITVWMGYATLGYAILFLPLSFFAIEKFSQTNKFKFLILLSFTIPLSFFSGHFQISLYFLLVICIYILYKFFTNKNIPNTLYLILYAFLGILMSLPQLLPSIELYSQSFRSGLFQVQEAIPWQYIPTFIAPDFLGNPVTRNDWFGHYAEWNGYIGVLPLMLAYYAINSKKRVQALSLFIFGIIAFVLAFNTPLLNFIVNLHIPVISTSAASRIIVVYSFLFAVLVSFGFDEFLEDIKRGKLRKIVNWLVIFLLIFLALWAIVLLKLFIPFEQLSVARQNLILPTVIFFISSSLIIIASIFKKHSKSPIFIFIISLFLIFIVSFDMLRFAVKWQAFDPGNLIYPNIKTTEEFTKLSGYDRVLGNLGAEALVYYKLPSIEGYDAVYIKRYGEFISSLNDGKVKEAARSVVSFPRGGIYTSKAINLLGVRYVIHKISDDHMNWAFPFWSYPKGNFNLIYDDGEYQVLENKAALPRAFLADEYKVITNRQKIIDTMFDNNFNLRKEIVLEKDPGIKKTKGDIGSAGIIKYSPNKINVEVQANHQGLLFLSDSFYNGWKVKVDGKESKIYRADYAFRAVTIPIGKHMVEFIYDPLSFRLGVYGFFVGLILIFGASIFTSRRSLWK